MMPTTSTATLQNSPLAMRAFHLVQTPRIVRRLAAVVAGCLVLAVAAMGLLPWQQTTAGQGRVIAYHPTERSQTVESPIKGRVARWGEGIVEGAKVAKGQVILELEDNDPLKADRLSLKAEAAREKLAAAMRKTKGYEPQIVALREAKEFVIAAGKALVQEAERKVNAARQEIAVAQAAVTQTKANLERQRKLFELGIRSGADFERDQRSYEEAAGKVSVAEEKLAAEEQYLDAKQAELEQKSSEAQAKIEQASVYVSEAEGEVALARKEVVEIEGELANFQRREILAPRDGVIFRLFANDQAEILKEGDPLFTLVPETSERAVELAVDGNDVALVRPGRRVRLQFEGWPAVQFASGWPHAAMGTFPGVVAAVDATDNGKGKFRILVTPEQETDWPSDVYLRQGARANGWVLLSEVRLGFELWRRLNGFPVVYDGSYEASADGSVKEKDKEVKKVKLPK